MDLKLSELALLTRQDRKKYDRLGFKRNSQQLAAARKRFRRNAIAKVSRRRNR